MKNTSPTGGVVNIIVNQVEGYTLYYHANGSCYQVLSNGKGFWLH